MLLDSHKVQLIKARSGMSSKDLAQRYQCSLSRMNALLHKKSVRTETAGKLARALNVDVSEIIEQ